MDRGMKDNPDGCNQKILSEMFEMFEMFELRDTKKLEPKPKPKEISKLQVRPLQKPSEK
jgi:hypothetical protein